MNSLYFAGLFMYLCEGNVSITCLPLLGVSLTFCFDFFMFFLQFFKFQTNETQPILLYYLSVNVITTTVAVNNVLKMYMLYVQMNVTFFLTVMDPDLPHATSLRDIYYTIDIYTILEVH